MLSGNCGNDWTKKNLQKNSFKMLLKISIEMFAFPMILQGIRMK